MCKGEAAKAMFGLFTLLVTSVTGCMRSYALVTAGKAEGCTGDVCVYLEAHPPSYSADCAPHRRTRHTPCSHAAAVRLRPFPAEVVPTRQVTAFPGN